MRRIKTIEGVELYDIICSRENVEAAVQAACRDHHKDPAVIRIRENPEPYIQAAIQILVTGSFHYSNFRTKRIFERGKQRNLCYTRTFPDRIIQHAVLQVVGPILLGTCIRDTYAAIKGKGLHRCNRYIREVMHNDPEGTEYCCKMDMSKYFPSIDRNKLFALIKKKIKCARTLEIISRMIFEVPGKKGTPVGLYSSQIFSTFYLTYFDHYCKEVLGIPYYARYMDDVVIFARRKIPSAPVQTPHRGVSARIGTDNQTQLADIPGRVQRRRFRGLRLPPRLHPPPQEDQDKLHPELQLHPPCRQAWRADHSAHDGVQNQLRRLDQ